MVSLARVQLNSLGQGKPWCRSFFNQTQVSVNVAEIFGGAGSKGLTWPRKNTKPISGFCFSNELNQLL